MCGKKLCANLAQYLVTKVSENIYVFDSDEPRVLPCAVVGYDSEEQSAPGLFGHFTIGGTVSILQQGRDEGNIDEVLQNFIAALMHEDINALNKPLGTDERAAKNFRLNALYIRGTDSEIEGESMARIIHFDAYCVAKD